MLYIYLVNSIGDNGLNSLSKNISSLKSLENINISCII